MRNAVPTSIAAALIAVTTPMFGSAARAGGFFDDFIAPYVQRVEGVTRGAGNAKDVNAATHTIDPWPRNVANRRITANGERMSGAVERYRDVRRQPLTPAPLAPTAIGLSGPASTSTSAPVAATPSVQ